MRRSFRAPVWVAMLALLVGPAVWAMGQGKGETKIDFQETAGDATSSRLFAKLNVAAGVAQLPETGSHSKNDNLAGWTVTFTMGSITLTGTADDKGKISTPFDGKLTANGGIMQIKVDGQNLDTGLPLTTTADGEFSVTVAIKVTATKTDPTTSVTTTVVLNDQPSVVFNYSVKKGHVKGRNF